MAKESFEDVVTALEKIAEMPRRDGELAFPEIGAIIAMVSTVKTARRNREQAEREYHQQQVCPKCGGIAEMMRPRGEQFRTFCGACQAYRKIVPEDLDLTDGEWAMICAELEIIYRDWKRRGSKASECINPHFDRENVKRRAA